MEWCCWIARASGGTEGLRRDETATVATVVCAPDAAGAEFLGGADGCNVRGTGCSCTALWLKSLSFFVSFLLCFLAIVHARRWWREKNRGLWSMGADAPTRFIHRSCDRVDPEPPTVQYLMGSAAPHLTVAPSSSTTTMPQCHRCKEALPADARKIGQHRRRCKKAT